MHSSIRGFLLSWGGSLVGEKEKRLGRLFRYVCSKPYVGREIGVFNNCEIIDQTIKNSFLNLFWDWVKLYIGGGFLLMLGFVDWLGSM